MRKVFFFTLLFLGFHSAFGQTPVGHYKGALTRDGSVQLINITFTGTDARYSIPELGLFDIKPEKYYLNKDTLHLKIFYGSFYCFLHKNSGDITGVNEKWKPEIRLHLKRSLQEEKKFTEEEIQFSNPPVLLSGVIFKPLNSNKPIPYVILIHGSGYQDRNSPYYRSLAYALASNGIGVLLYDKRGCGKSSGNWEKSSFSDLADDALAAHQLLKSRKDLNVSKTGFLGTSQGGWISTIAANKTTDCSFVVLNVGPSVSLFQQDIHRVQYSMTDEGWDKSVVDSAVAYTKLYFRFVRSANLKDWKALKIYGDAIKDQEWAGFINLTNEQNDEDILWWRKNAYDPAENLAKMKCPVLSIFGEKDVLVPPKENTARMDSLLRLSRTHYRIITIKGVAHNMLTYQGLNGADWNWPAVFWQWRKQPEEFFAAIIEWINNADF